MTTFEVFMLLFIWIVGCFVVVELAYLSDKLETQSKNHDK